jgi:hypothetical protein
MYSSMKYCGTISTKLTLTNRTDAYEIGGIVRDQNPNGAMKKQRAKEEEM